MGSQLDFMFDTGAFPHIKGGKLRALAIAADRRHALLPEVPTFSELGIKGMVMNAWYGLAGPAGTPPAVVARVNAAVGKALAAGDLSKRLQDLGAEVRSGTAADFSAFWVAEVGRYEGLVKLTGASLD
jgi:tripartite-type tricarboxylate transporter receptor subunit TctC